MSIFDKLKIQEANLQRVIEDEELAKSKGFKLKPTLYPIGMDTLPVGENNLNLSRRNYEDLPLVDEVTDTIRDIIKSEDRQDYEAELMSCEYRSDRDLYDSITKESLSVTPWALKQLILRTRPAEDIDAVSRAASYISHRNCPERNKCMLANFYLLGAVKQGQINPLTGFFRTRIDPIEEGKRQLFAVVSDRYNRDCDADRIARIINTYVEESKVPAKATALYDGHRFRMSILYHTDIKTPVVGELFKAGVTIDTADDGSRGITVTPMVIRNLCLNLIILDKATQSINLTHLRTNLYDSVSGAIRAAFDKVVDFGKKWADAREERILDSIYEHANPEEVFTELVKQGHIKISGVPKKELVEKLVNAWRVEPGYAKSDIVNAITRAAHTSTWGSPWVGTDLEEQAGKLLYNKLHINMRD